MPDPKRPCFRQRLLGGAVRSAWYKLSGCPMWMGHLRCLYGKKCFQWRCAGIRLAARDGVGIARIGGAAVGTKNHRLFVYHACCLMGVAPVANGCNFRMRFLR